MSILLFNSMVYAKEGIKTGNGYCLVCVDELSLSYAEILHKRDPYFPDKEHNDWGNHTALEWNLNLFEYLFWRNNTYFDTDDSQVRHVGWEWNAGIDFKHFELFHYHHSRHALEQERENFPLEDRYGIKFKIIK